MPKIEEIKILLQNKQDLNILGLCETFLNDNISDSELNIDGFEMERKDRILRAGGGIVVYISDNIRYKRRTDFEIGDIETIWLELNSKNSKPVYYCSAYRPPSAPSCWAEDLAREINCASCCDDAEIILTGDFNVDLFKEPPQSWTYALEEFYFSQLITAATRVTNTSSTLIDHFYTNKPDNMCEVNVPFIAISDHYPICATRKTKCMQQKGKHVEIEYRDFKKFDENKFLHDLKDVDFNNLLQMHDPNEILTEFYDLFNSILDQHAKVKTKRVKSEIRPKWMTQEINNARNLRDSYHKEGDMENYRIYRNKVSLLIDKSKSSYYKTTIEQSSNPKEMWNYLNQLTCNSKNITPSHVFSNGEIVDNLQDIANTFNNHFTDISNKLLMKLPKHDYDPNILCNFVRSKLDEETIFSIHQIEESEVFNMLNSLNINKSAGIDFIGPRLLKVASKYICKPITHLINASIVSGIFPTNLKQAKVTPIFKKGDKADPNNYRPISILPTISKLIEKHVAKLIQNFTNEFDLLTQSQSGFRELHSCQTSLTKLTESWLNAMDRGELIGITFIDFSKAFDLVNHDILLEKLNHYKFDQTAIKWFKSYLYDRTQCVKFGTCVSNIQPVTAGVPQESILGLLLFLLIKKFLPLHTRKLYYNAYILPSINYCLTVWGNAPKQDMDRLFKLQKRAARIILDASPDSSSKPLFEKLG
ncbi:uncharacterized protein LOC134262888, partial [Saccostrea cucullata]|uniref:uncharacterized protein LOC134262888 n=1 Tax=Saccostrea cuccullata TaxID=36930 RepID=UPI002ED2BB9D